MGEGKRESRRCRFSTFFVALPAGFFFGWAAPKKNQKNAAGPSVAASPPQPKNLIGSAPLPKQSFASAHSGFRLAASPLRQLLRRGRGSGLNYFYNDI